MKDLNDLYNELEKYNIPVVKVDFQNKKAGIITNGNDTVIAVDYKKIENSKEEKMIIAEEKAHYEECKAQNLDLNMARGKPAKAQLDLVSDILTVLTDGDDCIVDGVDARNYGVLEGLPCAREYWADVLGCKPELLAIYAYIA